MYKAIIRCLPGMCGIGIFCMSLLACAGTSLAVKLGDMEVPKDKFITFFFLGHSNMFGWAEGATDNEIHPRCWWLAVEDWDEIGSTSPGWRPAQDSAVPKKNRCDAGFHVIKRFAKAYPDYHFGIVKISGVGHMSSSYVTGGDQRSALEAGIKAVKDVSIIGGVFTMLGSVEADHGGSDLSGFMQNSQKLIAEIRGLTGNPNLPFMWGKFEVNMGIPRTYGEQVNLLIEELPGNDPVKRTAICPKDPVPESDYADSWHYDWKGYELYAQGGFDIYREKGFDVWAEPDTKSPHIVKCLALNEHLVMVEFNEQLDAQSAVKTTNYSLSPSRTVSAVEFMRDKFSVILTVDALSPKTTYTVSANGVKDISPASNSSATSATCIYTDQLNVYDLSVSTSKPYVWSIMNTGAQIYMDNTGKKVASVPEVYKGQRFLMTANADRFNKDTAFLSFMLSKPAMVYLVHDDRIAQKPAGYAQFRATGDSIKSTDGVTFTVYSRQYPAGKVTIGGQINGGNKLMYFIMIDGAGNTSIAPGNIPRVLAPAQFADTHAPCDACVLWGIDGRIIRNGAGQFALLPKNGIYLVRNMKDGRLQCIRTMGKTNPRSMVDR